MAKMVKIFLLCINVLLLVPMSYTQQCYKRCNCLQKNFYKNECAQDVTDLSLHFNTKEINIYCKKMISMETDGVQTFDASYLSIIDDKSPLTIEAMIRKCYRTKKKNIKYAIDFNRLHNISAKQILLENENNIKYLNIQGFSNIEKQINISILGPQIGKNLENLVLYNVAVPDLKYLFGNIPKIKTLNLISNNINSLPEYVFLNLTNLNTLSLRENKMRYLNQSMFKGSININVLDLSTNMIENVESTTFSDMAEVKSLNLSSNNLKTIKTGTFASMSKLEQLDLSKNRNISLPQNIFYNLSSLINLNLSGCYLADIPEKLFQECQDLQSLNISRNELKSLENNTFQNLSKLVILDLSYNRLESLSTALMFPLKKLKHIYLGSNKLTTFSSELFWNIASLETLDVSNNLIGRFYNSLGRFHAYSVNLKDNNITKFPSFLLHVVVNLKHLDLSSNKISSVELMKEIIPKSSNMDIDLSNNVIQEINITPRGAISPATLNRNWTLTLNLTKNHLKCNCRIFKLDSVFEKQENAVLRITSQENICMGETKNSKCPIIHIKNCPARCLCYFREVDTSIVVNCSFRNLTKYPEVTNLEAMHPLYNHNQTIVSLEGNNLSDDGQESLERYDNVTELDLSFNKIRNINWIPRKVWRLNLANNSLTMLYKNFIALLEKNMDLKWIILQGNPWICDCNANYLQKYLREYNNLKVDPSQILCQDTREKLLHAEVCKVSSSSLKVALPVGLTTFVAFISALLAFYYRYSTNIKVFLYSKNWCLWFVEEEEIDKEKTYDIFISYSHKDENFVQTELLPQLESGESPFKLCIHYRDWLPGEFISKQIINSVLDSRRTLVILSNNFMESVWGKMEFRTAHMQAIKEGRARVIVVIYGDLDESNLGDEMNAYLKTNTYVRWGDPWFWNKLKYALPHSKNNRKILSHQNQESYELKQTSLL